MLCLLLSEDFNYKKSAILGNSKNFARKLHATTIDENFATTIKLLKVGLVFLSFGKAIETQC